MRPVTKICLSTTQTLLCTVVVQCCSIYTPHYNIPAKLLIATCTWVCMQSRISYCVLTTFTELNLLNMISLWSFSRSLTLSFRHFHSLLLLH
jgi:hypothetical protein